MRRLRLFVVLAAAVLALPAAAAEFRLRRTQPGIGAVANQPPGWGLGAAVVPTAQRGVAIAGFDAAATDPEGGAVTHTIQAGALPAGLSLSAAGLVTGTPTAEGSFSFTIRAVDPLGAAATRGYFLDVLAAPSCAALMTGGGATSGSYDIDPDGAGLEPSQTVYCDQSSDGGGWTYAIHSGIVTNPYIASGAVTTAALATGTGDGKLSDATINAMTDATTVFRMTCAGDSRYFKNISNWDSVNGNTGSVATAWNGSFTGAYGESGRLLSTAAHPSGQISANNGVIWGGNIGCYKYTTGWNNQPLIISFK